MKAFCEFIDYEIAGEYEDAGKSTWSYTGENIDRKSYVLQFGCHNISWVSGEFRQYKISQPVESDFDRAVKKMIEEQK